jgi:hypothetical protein
MLRYWMPDQVRHDGQELTDFLNYDTVWKAGIKLFQYVLDAPASGCGAGGSVIPDVIRDRHDELGTFTRPSNYGDDKKIFTGDI